MKLYSLLWQRNWRCAK